jgi:hypothetical protein
MANIVNICSIIFIKILGLTSLELQVFINGMEKTSLLDYFTNVLPSKSILGIYHDMNVIKIELCYKKSGATLKMSLFCPPYLKIHVTKTATCCTRANNFQNIFFVCILDCEFGLKRVPLLCNIANYRTRRGLDF